MRWIAALMLLILIPVSFAQSETQCRGALPSRLIIGSDARVLPGDANNVRNRAGLSGSRIGQIPGGARFSVLEGPTCADGYAWWKVDYRGLIGWTAEADDEYWLEPIIVPTPVPTTTPTPAPTTSPTSIPTTTSANEAGSHSSGNSQTIASEPAEGVIFFETFDNNDANWLVGTWTGSGDTEGNISKREIINGRYEITITTNQQVFGRTVPPNLEVSGNYEFSFDVTILEKARNIVLLALFDLKDWDNYRRFYYHEADEWYLIDSVDGTRSADAKGAFNVHDGNPHRITVRVEDNMYTVFIDGQQLPTVFPTLGVPGGLVGFGLQNSWFTDDNSLITVKAAFDNFEVRQLTNEAASGSDETDLVSFVSVIPRLSLQTPRGWYQVTRNQPNLSRFNNEDVYNIEIFNNPEGSARSAGNLRIQIYDPVQVMETAGLFDSREAELEDALNAFLSPSARSRGQLESISLSDNREALRFTLNRTRWYALRSSDESITLAEIDFGRQDDIADSGALVESIISTLDYPTPPQNTPQGNAVNNMIEALFSDNPDSVLLNICAEDAAATLLFIAGVDAFTDIWSGLPPSANSSTTLSSRQAQSATVDTSGLYYDVVSESEDAVSVRLMGNLRLVAPDGTAEIRPMETSVGPAFSRFGQNTYRVQEQDGFWVVCGGTIGF